MKKMLRLQTKDDLDSLHSGNVKESLHLEFKASESVDKKDEHRVEMAAMTAFANADGGRGCRGRRLAVGVPEAA